MRALFFQFLLVRLRVKVARVGNVDNPDLSIPSGAIKSIAREREEKLERYTFNSFWCD